MLFHCAHTVSEKENDMEIFTEEQRTALAQPLNLDSVKQRKGSFDRETGTHKMLAYLTGKHVIDTANRIFGYGGWGYRVVARSREAVADEKKGTMEYYSCDIELFVVGAAFSFPGSGVGIVTAPYTVEAHEKARKEAETDAMKRALRHYGPQFGSSLYDGEDYVETGDGTHVQVSDIASARAKRGSRKTAHAPAKAMPLPKALHAAIGAAKQRAAALGVAHNAEEWEAICTMAGIKQIQAQSDIDAIQRELDGIEARQLQAAQ